MTKIYIDEMTQLAKEIADGQLKISLTFCIEGKTLYIYKDNFWQELHEIELNKIILEDNYYQGIVGKHSVKKREQIIDNLRIFTQKRQEHFNKTGFLNFDIGEFDPIACRIYEHDKENYSTFRIPYPYNSSAECPLWLKTLNEIFEDNNEKINVLQEFFGYCLTRDTTQRKALLLLGESNCGKSTILQVLRAMVSSRNCSSVTLKYLSHPQYTPMLVNKLVNIDSDVSASAEEFEAQFKIITSGEPVNCNQKFVKTFDFMPHCKIVMAANVFPKITDHSSAVYNRLILIPFTRIFTDLQQNKELFKQLQDELSGIFNWSIEGLKRLQIRGRFEQFDFLKEAVQELEDENNPSNIFFEDHLQVEIGENIYIEKGELYEKYKQWCIETKNYTLSKARFASCVYKKFHKETPKDTKLPNGGKRIWRNLKYIENKEVIEEKGQLVNWNE